MITGDHIPSRYRSVSRRRPRIGDCSSEVSPLPWCVCHDIEASVAFTGQRCLKELSRMDTQQGRFTLWFWQTLEMMSAKWSSLITGTRGLSRRPGNCGHLAIRSRHVTHRANAAGYGVTINVRPGMGGWSCALPGKTSRLGPHQRRSQGVETFRISP